MSKLGISNYYWQWLTHTFRGPWGLSSLIGSILALLVPLAIQYAPGVRSHATTANNLLWQVPLVLFLALAMIRFLLVPRELHVKESERARFAEDQLAAINATERPYVVVTREIEIIDDDPEAAGPYTREHLRFTNVGPEAALIISIDPIPIAGHDVTLWAPIDLLKKDEHHICLPRGGISSGLERARKSRQFNYTEEVRLPLVARYTDRRGKMWTTPHEIIARGADVRIEPRHSPTAGPSGLSPARSE